MHHDYPTPITERLAAAGVRYNKHGRIVCIQGSRDKDVYEYSPGYGPRRIAVGA